MSEHPLSGCMGHTLDYYILKENLDCQLWVAYLHYGLMSYKRNSNEGGIGMECCFISQPGGSGEPQLSKWQPLKYVEWLQTLKSFILEKALLNNVVEWFHFKSFFFLQSMYGSSTNPSVMTTWASRMFFQ